MTATFLYATCRTPFGRFGDGTITAGNASPLYDGASALVLGSEAAADLLGRPPLARVAGRGVRRGRPAGFRDRTRRGGEQGPRTRRDHRVAAVCIGVGQDLAVVLENPEATGSA